MATTTIPAEIVNAIVAAVSGFVGWLLHKIFGK